MADHNEPWDFECPQFVDFQAGLESSGRDDIFFEFTNHESPDEGNFCKTPGVSNPKENLKEEVEDKLLDKMSVALSILENTPKVRSTVKGKNLVGKFHKNFCSEITKSTFKCKTGPPAPRAGLRRSRSIGHLNKIVTGNQCKGKLRRSSSLNDIATLKRRYPVTPMCLKRTIVKAKAKVIKTSEEMELEEIAKLQKILKDHLRYNEMHLKRLGLKPRSCVMSKTQAKPENLKEGKNVASLMKKSTLPEKEIRRNIHALPHAAVKNEAKKLESIINNRSVSCKKIVKEADFKKSNNSAAIAEPEKSSIQRIKKPAVNKILDHSGLLFLPSVKSTASVKPFRFGSFQIKSNQGNDELTGAKQKDMSHSKIINKHDGKENIRPQSATKKTESKLLLKAICDLNKLSQSNEVIEKRKGIPLKDVPVSENVAR